jgi:hypothetical protein
MSGHLTSPPEHNFEAANEYYAKHTHQLHSPGHRSAVVIITGVDALCIPEKFLSSLKVRLV